MRALLPLLLLAGCASEEELDLKIANLDRIEFAIPASWTSVDQSEHQTKIVVWSPPNNTHKESIALMRTHELPALANSNFTRVQAFLTDAQKSLPDYRVATARRFTTKQGLPGALIDGQFLPDGAKTPYRRIHAVVLDGASLVHVVYTAADGSNRKPLELVLDTLTRKPA